MNLRIHTLLALCAFLPLACTSPSGAARARAPRDDLGTWTRGIDARTAEAQRWFDNGLVLDFAFNHDEAIACFERAKELDPEHPMPYYGIALASGPHINNSVMPPEACKRAWANLQGALERKARASEVDRALIDALAMRYVEEPPADRKGLDVAYAEGMRVVHARYPNDPDVAHLYAEALMNLQPWDLWTTSGEPKGRALEILGVIETALARTPAHPGLNHLHIHAAEASPEPRRAKASADLLRDLVPGAGHLVHMPAHIDVRLGDYQLASETNERAMEVDSRNGASVPAAGFYRVYMAHNAHFLAFSSMMEGRSSAALAAARYMVAGVPKEFLEQAPAVVDGLMPVVFHVLVRFGRFEEVLEEPAFPKELIAANAIRHYARGVAFTATDRLDEARAELRELERLTATIDERIFGINPPRTSFRSRSSPWPASSPSAPAIARPASRS
jgi:tetratricopeptide (TPR) repeat protein